MKLKQRRKNDLPTYCMTVRLPRPAVDRLALKAHELNTSLQGIGEVALDSWMRENGLGGLDDHEVVNK
jgi:hypothetical protein